MPSQVVKKKGVIEAMVTRDEANIVADDLEGYITQSYASRTYGYQARIVLIGDALEKNADKIDIAINRGWPRGVAIGLKARLKNKISINSPERGLVRRSDYGTMFDAGNVASGIFAFGQQLAAIEAFGGKIKAIDIHIVCPPAGKKIVNWKIQ